MSLFTSALWDLMKGTTGFILNGLLRTLTFIFHGYVETIHRDIGEARQDGLGEITYLVVVGLGLILLRLIVGWVEIFAEGKYRKRHKLKYRVQRLADPTVTTDELRYNTKNPDELKEKLLEDFEDLVKWHSSVKKVTLCFRALILISLMFFLYISAKISYTESASNFVDRSIEILAPTIPPEKVLQLRANYRAVDSAQKFYDLYDELQKTAKEKNVTLPKFRVIKR